MQDITDWLKKEARSDGREAASHMQNLHEKYEDVEEGEVDTENFTDCQRLIASYVGHTKSRQAKTFSQIEKELEEQPINFEAFRKGAYQRCKEKPATNLDALLVFRKSRKDEKKKEAAEKVSTKAMGKAPKGN